MLFILVKLGMAVPSHQSIDFFFLLLQNLEKEKFHWPLGQNYIINYFTFLSKFKFYISIFEILLINDDKSDSTQLSPPVKLRFEFFYSHNFGQHLSHFLIFFFFQSCLSYNIAEFDCVSNIFYYGSSFEVSLNGTRESWPTCCDKCVQNSIKSISTIDMWLIRHLMGYITYIYVSDSLLIIKILSLNLINY